MSNELPYWSQTNTQTLYDIVNLDGFDFAENVGDYPIWDESKRDWLNGMLYNHFSYREVASETPEAFFHWFNDRLNRIMPKVNPIAAAALGFAEGSPLDWERTGKTDTTAHVSGDSSTETGNTQTNSGDSKATALSSATPQTQLSGTENYMTGLNETGSTTSGTSEGTGTADTITTQDSTTGTIQSSGQLAELMANWALKAPDVLGIIYEALEVCFMQVW